MSALSTGVDHVLVAVADLNSGRVEMRETYGLDALTGGRHPGAGTANMIVPLGPDYIELITIVDQHEASANPLSRRVANALAAGSRLAGWSIRVTDLGTIEARLRAGGLETTGIRPGSRRRPDGTLLKWRTLHVGDGLQPAWPFFIEWDLNPTDHPGASEVAHPRGRADLSAVRIMTGDPVAFGQLLMDVTGQSLAVDMVAGPADRLLAAVLRRDGREMIIQ